MGRSQLELIVKTFGELSNDELYEIMKLRSMVFVVEQECVYQDLDDRDQDAVNVFYRDDAGIEAYLRVMDKNEHNNMITIGRVVSIKRRSGLATALLKEGIRIAEDRFGAEKVYIEAQVYARSLYEKIGFGQVSEEFLEDGIPHIKMIYECGNKG